MEKQEIIEYLERFIPDSSEYWNGGFRDLWEKEAETW
jgi:hypothetical protein